MNEYPRKLKYFMWPYQVHFRISAQVSAESLFNHLDSNLTPEVFFIGFQHQGDKSSHEICFEHPDFEKYLPELKNINNVANQISENHPDSNMYYTGVGMQEEMDTRLKNECFRLALEHILNGTPDSETRIFFAAPGKIVNNYKVFIILILDKSVYQAHSFLKNRDEESRMSFILSLIEAVKNQYLESHAEQLTVNKNDRSGGRTIKTEELLREGSEQFLHTIAWAGRTITGIHRLFNACTQLSISRYEGNENNGQLLICDKDNLSIEVLTEIVSPFELIDYQKVRKMMQLSTDEVGVITDGEKVYGLGKIKDDYDVESESVFSIIFRGIHCYDVHHSNDILLKMRFGLPYLSQEIISWSSFSATLRRVFETISDTQVVTLYGLATAVANQRRGAILVFAEDAEIEAKRLAHQCISIKPLKLSSELILTLSSIDGAVLSDINGYGHAKGIILDGIVGLGGNAARGSRYNSAITYQEFRASNRQETVLVVVSSDGMIDIIPKLKPKINHQEIVELIEILKKLNAKETFDRKTFYNTMKLLEKKEFYLTSEECMSVNLMKKNLEKIDQNASDGSMWILHDDLKPNPNMNDSYYE